ncbi:tryptophan 2,3-dioxygenase [Patella vulgata]|uniref:tryptophan 2,3-dioxygenase n=1 Tax=Patella vulgata TaxID=6465 RepID=UPI0024A7C109|nr:tryptophan 2,3-dioxygenase [Patella vulgata]
MSDKEINYASYLKLGEGYVGPKVTGLLDCVGQLSSEPEEHLFITVHHGFEIWFKQILFDFGRIKKNFELSINNPGSVMEKKALGEMPTLIMRCRDLLRMLLGNFQIMESMGQLAFMNFRGKLTGGSGFQSLQFRLIENIFGLKEENRKGQTQFNYKEKMKPEQIERVNEAFREQNIFELTQTWLASILEKFGKQKFINSYQKSVSDMQKAGSNTEHLRCVYDENLFNELRKRDGKNPHTFRNYFTYDGFLGALLVHQLQAEPEYQIPYQIITLILDVDEAIMTWRGRHVNMVHRMIGSKPGTGGTSGYDYLSSTVSDQYKVFWDLFTMSTYVIPSVDFKITK